MVLIYNLSVWLTCYLHDKNQQTNNKHFPFLPVTDGVSQVSLLFLIYITDICDNLRNSTKLFADVCFIIATPPDNLTFEDNVITYLVNCN